MIVVNDKIFIIVNGKCVIIKKLEFFVFVGNFEKLKIVVYYGVDVVFIGGQEYGLCLNVDNFMIEEIVEGVEFVK